MKTIAGKTKRKPKAAAARKPQAKRKPTTTAASGNRVAVATLKQHLSRYVREVQQSGQPITVTQHGRDAAVLAPPASSVDVAPLHVRPPLDPRPLGELVLRPLPGGERLTEKDIQDALDETRADRF